MSGQAKLIADRLERVVNRLIHLERRSVFEYGGVKLHPSEMHLLLAVESNPDINPTRLAEVLGVTKGAVSQTLARLEKKDMLERRRSDEAAREVSVHFTAAGSGAVAGFKTQRQAVNAAMGAWLTGLSAEEAGTIMCFLGRLEDNLTSLE